MPKKLIPFLIIIIFFLDCPETWSPDLKGPTPTSTPAPISTPMPGIPPTGTAAPAATLQPTAIPTPTPTQTPRMQYSITMTIEGSGSVLVTPENNQYLSNSEIIITPVCELGWRFDHWEGDIKSYEFNLVITITNNLALTVVFVPVGNDDFQFSIDYNGDNIVNAENYLELSLYEIDYINQTAEIKYNITSISAPFYIAFSKNLIQYNPSMYYHLAILHYVGNTEGNYAAAYDNYMATHLTAIYEIGDAVFPGSLYSVTFFDFWSQFDFNFRNSFTTWVYNGGYLGGFNVKFEWNGYAGADHYEIYKLNDDGTFLDTQITVDTNIEVYHACPQNTAFTVNYIIKAVMPDGKKNWIFQYRIRKFAQSLTKLRAPGLFY